MKKITAKVRVPTFFVVFFICIFSHAINLAGEKKQNNKKLNENKQNEHVFANGTFLLISGKKVELKMQENKNVIWADIVNCPEKCKLLKSPVVYPAQNETNYIHLIFQSDAGGSIEVLYLHKKNERKLTKLWEGSTLLKGDFGEKQGITIQMIKKSGSKNLVPVTGKVSQNTTICNMESLPVLNPKMYDLDKNKFVNAYNTFSFDKFETIEDTRKEQGENLLKNNKKTFMKSACKEPFGQSVWGDFFTYKLFAGSYPITKINFKISGLGKNKNTDMPNIFIATSQDIFKVSPASIGMHGKVIVLFPSPQNTNCVSIIFSGKNLKQKKPLKICDVDIITSDEGAGRLQRLAKDLKNPVLRIKAKMLLEQAGEDAVAPVLDIWENLDVHGKRLAIKILAKYKTYDAQKILVEAATDEDAIISGAAKKNLDVEKAVYYLEKLLTEKENPRYPKAIKLLGRIDNPEAMGTLVKEAGEKNLPQKEELRNAISALSLKNKVNFDFLIKHIDLAIKEKNREKIINLLLSASKLTKAANYVKDKVLMLFPEWKKFEDRFLLIKVIQDTACADYLKILLSAIKSEDHIIRESAIKAVAKIDNLGKHLKIISELQKALDDSSVIVRLAALNALGRRDIASICAKLIIALMNTEEWPVVRARAVSFVKYFNKKDALFLMLRALNDKSPVVRFAAAKLERYAPMPEIDLAILNLIKNPKETFDVKIEVIKAAKSRCMASAVDVLGQILKKGALPLAETKDMKTASAAAFALGAIGGKKAKKYLKKAGERSSLSLDKVIKKAGNFFGAFCEK